MCERDQAREGWRRSSNAWIAAIERGDLNRTQLLDPVMLDYAGDVRGQLVVDVGAGEGRFCRMLAKRGARTIGVEPADVLVLAAQRAHPSGSYISGDAEALPFHSDCADLVISYVTLVDIPDFRTAIHEMARVIRPGGRLLIAHLNPFATTRNGWLRDENGVKLYVPIDDYFTERGTPVAWAGIEIYNWHRPMEAYMSTLLASGLLLRKFCEPKPSAEAIANHPGLASGCRVPWFHVMLWQKPANEDASEVESPK